MEVDSASALLMLIVATLFVTFVAAAEVALASISRSRIRYLLEQNVDRAGILEALLENPAEFLSTLMLVKSAAYLTTGAVVFWAVDRLSLSWPEQIFTLALSVLFLVLVQIGSRAVTLRDPETVALRLGPSVRFLASLLQPFSMLMRWVGAKLRGDAQEVTAESIFLSEDGLRFLINVGEGEGVIEEEEKQMIASIFELGETIVREIMVPRLDVVALDVETAVPEALDLIIKRGHSRIPVYEESIDHVIGFLYAKDLLRYFREGQNNVPLRQLVRKAYFVPESKKLDELFHEMQSRRVHAAVVVDEYGGTAGLVTIEDLLEEIVGEIQDEYDTEKPFFQQLAPTVYLFNARIDLDEVSDRIGVDLAQDNDVDTLGGFIYNQLGRVPVQGETIEYAGRKFTVISIEARRIGQIRVEWTEPAALPEDGVEWPSLNGTVKEPHGNTKPFLRHMT